LELRERITRLEDEKQELERMLEKRDQYKTAGYVPNLGVQTAAPFGQSDQEDR
jgi:hypothetical protein